MKPRAARYEPRGGAPRPLGALVSFPARVWEPCGRGLWSSRPATAADREGRRAVARALRAVDVDAGEEKRDE